MAGARERRVLQHTSPGSPARTGEHPLVFVLVAACLGVACDRHLAVAPWVWSAGLLVALGGWYVARRRQTRGAALLILISVAALAGLWHHDRWRLYAADEIGRYAPDEPGPVCVRVVALEPPRWRPAEQPTPLSTMVQGEMTRLAVRVVALRHAARWQPASGRVTLLVDGSLSEILRGDTLEVAGTLARVRTSANPGEPNVAAMWRRNRELALLHCGHPACIKLLARGTRWNALRQLGQVRVWAERVLDRHMAAPQSALAAALLLGSRERLDRTTVDQFFVSGTVHLLSISGSHVAILASIMWIVIRLDWFPRRRMLVLTCGLAVAYALLTGAQPPVVRATTLIVVYCLARWTQRRAVAWNSLSAAGLVTLGLSPGGMYDVGTQLSYLAVAVLIVQRPHASVPHDADPLRRLIRQNRPGWSRALHTVGCGARQIVVASTMIWLISMPLVANRFHLVSLVGVVANLLLWLPIPLALFSGLAVLLAAPLPPLAAVFGWICERALALTQWLMMVSAAPRCGHVWVAGPPEWLVVVFYLLLAAYQFRLIPLPRRWWLALLATWLVLNMAGSATVARAQREVFNESLRYSFVALGHGTSVLVELPGGRTLLYDAGRMGNPEAAVLPISAVLWSRRIAHIDAVILSHADADHVNALPALLDRFSVGVVYASPVMWADRGPTVAALRAALAAAGVPMETLREGDRWSDARGAALEILHPPPEGCAGGDNSNSVVVRVGLGDHTALLAGDLEQAGLDELLAEPPLACDVLVAPHHGSRRSRPVDIVRWAAPKLVVVSEGAAADADTFLSDYASAGAQVRWTQRDGMIEVLLDRAGLRARAWRGGAPRTAGYSARERSR